MGSAGKQGQSSGRGHDHPDIPEGRNALHFSTIYDRFDGSKVTVWLLLVLCALTAAWVAPSHWAARTYDVSSELLGSPSQGDIKAPRDIAVEDREVTQARRTAAITAVKRVYDLDTHVLTASRQTLSKGFSQARERLSQLEEEKLPGDQ